MPTLTDRLTVRVVVVTLGVVVVGSLALMGLLALTHTAIPDVLDRAFTGALTGLLGLLAKTSTAEPDHAATTNTTYVQTTSTGDAAPVTAAASEVEGLPTKRPDASPLTPGL